MKKLSNVNKAYAGNADFIWEYHDRHVQIVREHLFNILKKEGFKAVDKNLILDENDGDEFEDVVVYPSRILTTCLPPRIKVRQRCWITGSVHIPVINESEGPPSELVNGGVITCLYDTLLIGKEVIDTEGAIFQIEMLFTKNYDKISKHVINYLW